MGNFTTRLNNAAARRCAAARMIQLGVGDMAAAEIVRKLPARLVKALARGLDMFGEMNEGNFTLEGKPLAVAEQDYISAADELQQDRSAS